ncbi:Uncharacterized protein PBTT_04236 [Plasmodiophora brassicae]|uniref:Uncharacterized protein n=1 Tax=Plasmodiophora brassicae TaxID=37360 RepID=A0A3P3Y996_PLABS|nr:unnamed protein product [Plasmodiophora brassicae]
MEYHEGLFVEAEGMAPLSVKQETGIVVGESDDVETIVCRGQDTYVPKMRSFKERQYICNGTPIHRVTFWRHRKHGCPNMPGPRLPRKTAMVRADSIVKADFDADCDIDDVDDLTRKDDEAVEDHGDRHNVSAGMAAMSSSDEDGELESEGEPVIDGDDVDYFRDILGDIDIDKVPDPILLL